MAILNGFEWICLMWNYRVINHADAKQLLVLVENSVTYPQRFN